MQYTSRKLRLATRVLAEVKISDSTIGVLQVKMIFGTLNKLTWHKEYPIQRDAVSIYCKQVGVNQTVKLIPEVFSSNLIYNKPLEPNSLHYQEVSSLLFIEKRANAIHTPLRYCGTRSWGHFNSGCIQLLWVSSEHNKSWLSRIAFK